MTGLKLYGRYLGISLRAQMEYRASFFMQTLGHFLVTLFEFLAIWALFDRFGSLKGWSLAEVAVFYGTVSVAFAVSEALTRGFDVADRMIRHGDFDRMLLRPRSVVLQLMGYELTLRRVGRLAQGTVVLIFGMVRLNLDVTLAKIGLLAWSMTGGCCLFAGLLVAQATVAFWTTESLEIMNALTYGGIETAQYPMTIYLTWFRRFFTFVVPLACVNYYPVLAVIEKADPLGAPRWLSYVGPAAGIVFLGAALAFWRVGVRHYSSTGS